MTCDICNENVYRVRLIGNGVFACQGCRREPPKEYAPLIVNRVFLHGEWTTIREMDEVRRRVPLNVKKDGTYDLGRRSENGRIEEREPTY